MSTRRTAGASISSAIWATDRLKKSVRKSGSTRVAGRWPQPSLILRGTGNQDLFIANDYGISELYFNDGKQFREVGKQTGVGFSPKSGMNASVGDVLNQGRYSIYVSNISEEGVLIQGNNLWVPREGTTGDSLEYDNLARAMDVEMGGWSFGAQFGDLNNDGTLDLYLVNGYVSADRKRITGTTFQRSPAATRRSFPMPRTGRRWMGAACRVTSRKEFGLNDGAGKFVNVAQAVGASDVYDGRAVALVDLWNRGVLDVVVANQKGPLLIYKNNVTPENKWISFELEGAASNRSAIGAEVRLFWNGHQQVQQVSGGSGFCSQNQRRLHFGVGKNPQIEKAEIRWPSGKIADDSKSPPSDKSIRSRSQHESIGCATCRALRLFPSRDGRSSRLDNRYLPPLFITSILLVGHFAYGILESYERTALAIVCCARCGVGAGPDLFWQVAQSRQRLHLRNQCRHSGSFACVLAVCVVQRDFDHVEVRVASEGPSSLESFELWNLRVVVSRAGDSGGSDDSVGKLYLAAAGDLDSWVR